MSALIVLRPQLGNPISREILAVINGLIRQQWDCVVLTSSGEKPFHPDLQGPGVSAEEIAAHESDSEPYTGISDSTCGGGPVTATMQARAAKTIRIYEHLPYNYNAFDGDGVDGVSLLTQLQARQINRVTICGFTDILATAMAAYNNNFLVSVYADDPSQVINEDVSRWQRHFTFI